MRSTAALMLAAALAACAPSTPRPVGFADLPGWAGDTQAEVLPALRATCTAIASLPLDRDLGGTGPTLRTAASLAPACAELDTLPAGDAAARAAQASLIPLCSRATPRWLGRSLSSWSELGSPCLLS
jgi:hypothetical protein